MTMLDVRADETEWLSDEKPAGGLTLRHMLPAVSAMCLVVVDIVVLVAAFLFAHWLRFVANGDETAALPVDDYARMALTIGCVMAGLLALHGLYNVDARPSWPKRLNAIVSAVSTALILAVALGVFLGNEAFSRVWFGTGWAISVVSLVVWRSMAQRAYEVINTAVAPVGRVVIVGANPLGRELSSELAEHLEVVGYVDNGTDLPGDTLDYPLLGSIAELDRIVNAYGVDELVIALPANRREQIERLIHRGFHRRLKVKLLPGLDSLLPQRFEVQALGRRRYIEFAPIAAVRWPKRALDLLITGAGVLAISPLLIAIAVAVKLDSPGPVFYRQQRVGKNGRHFWMYKFRSMVVDADRRLAELRTHNEATGPLFKMRRDPRITRIGAFLRRWSLDELPQLLNVLRGEMSLVGPRPPLPSEVAEYEDWQMGRLRAVPGLTGLWQVSGRSEVPFHDMVRLDLHYIRNWSFGLDVEILLRTIPAVMTNRGAY
jgi:exopolysaccharide biosynthesis polyprenyl glycosylphosphotransferase